jgi:NitT/TauT family transport system ATP-binding protein
MNLGNPLIELKDVSKDFRLDSGITFKVFDKINLSVYDNELVALLGPSGCGKSTCLRIMAGLLPPSSGQVMLRQNPLQGTNSEIALVFQSFALFPWETVHSNIALALRPLGLPKTIENSRVKKAIDLVGLEGFEEAYPRELSGGMKQRVGVARALVVERPLLFLNEPFSSLDVLTADTLREEMVKIFLDKQTPVKSMLLVTHNIQEAVFMAKRILVMSTNPGFVRAEIVNDLPYPRDDQSLAFRRMVNQIHSLIAETMIPDTPVSELARLTRMGKDSSIEILPKVQMPEVIGLLEAITNEGGYTDIFELSHKIGKDFGLTLYLVKAAELLGLVETPKQNVFLTELGLNFLAGDINQRKNTLHQQLAGLRIVQLTEALLKNSENVRLPVEVLYKKMQEWLPNENPHQISEVLISWGRFAEYFGYNDDTKEIYLDVGQETT